MPTTFSSLSLEKPQQALLASLGFTHMTDIQAASLPMALAGRDILAQAPTGSGKTVAFSLPLINRLTPKFFAVQALVLCPTRELAGQVAEEIRRLARHPGNIKVLTLCGGQPIGRQIGSLEHGAHIIVGTPGRISDHLRKQTLDIQHVRTLVLDEADRMLDMGFKDEILAIVDQLPSDRQSLLFSATFPTDIQKVAAEVLVDPLDIRVESTQTPHADIHHRVFISNNADIDHDLLTILSDIQPNAGLIFCNTREQCNTLGVHLKQMGVSTGVLHGEMDQRERDQIVVRFTNGSLRLLVATDVAARGLDIDSVDLVINYGLPRDTAVFTHRCGRTGRAGRQGTAISLILEKEMHKLGIISQQTGLELSDEPIPQDNPQGRQALKPRFRTLEIGSGKKHKIRPGDIVGALTATKEISGSDIGVIAVQDFVSYVALPSQLAEKALEVLRQRPIKGRAIKVRKI